MSCSPTTLHDKMFFVIFFALSKNQFLLHACERQKSICFTLYKLQNFTHLLMTIVSVENGENRPVVGSPVLLLSSASSKGKPHSARSGDALNVPDGHCAL